MCIVYYIREGEASYLTKQCSHRPGDSSWSPAASTEQARWPLPAALRPAPAHRGPLPVTQLVQQLACSSAAAADLANSSCAATEGLSCPSAARPRALGLRAAEERGAELGANLRALVTTAPVLTDR